MRFVPNRTWNGYGSLSPVKPGVEVALDTLAHLGPYCFALIDGTERTSFTLVRPEDNKPI